MKLMHKSKQVG